MPSKKKSFVMHIDSLGVLDELSDEQAGKLFKAIKSHHCGDEIIDCAITKIAFAPFKAQFARDNEKYEKIAERNRINGLKGGRPQSKKNPEEPRKPSGLFGNPEEPRKADSGSGSGSGSGSKSKDPLPANAVDFSVLQISNEEIAELKRIRKKNRGGEITQRVANALAKEFGLAKGMGYSADEVLTEWETRSWKSFKAVWLEEKNGGTRLKNRQSTNWEPLDA